MKNIATLAVVGINAKTLYVSKKIAKKNAINAKTVLQTSHGSVISNAEQTAINATDKLTKLHAANTTIATNSLDAPKSESKLAKREKRELT